MFVLEGHIGFIRDIYIASDDINVVSTCLGGHVFWWNLLLSNDSQGYRHNESSIYNTICCDIFVNNDKENYG